MAVYQPSSEPSSDPAPDAMPDPVPDPALDSALESGAGSTERIEATEAVEPLSDQAGTGDRAESEPAEPVEASEPDDPPTEPIRAAALSSWWPDSALGPMSAVPGWLIAAAAVVLLGVIGMLGFVKPGYFVTPVLDQASVGDGVGMILRNDYRLPNVTAVTCPADQVVQPGRSFSCVAVVDGKRSEVPVVIQDTAGRYQVGRPVPA